ncbi:MAG: hypothetical protein LQ343_001121 [Gyalolechia ehrenbergii]|nr:MAG: hypothetical protein LQ343_001121 [Gyalolechia ehrenbergii]
MSSSAEEKHSVPTPPASSPVQSPASSFNGTISRQISQDSEDLDPDQDHLVYAFGQLSVRKDLPMAERMFILLEGVFQRAVETHNINLGPRDWHDKLRRADGNSRRGDRDVETLKWIRDVLDQLRLSVLEDFTRAVDILADASRDASWRLPFGQSGLLELFLRVSTDPDLEDDVLAPILRLVGNCCIDADLNREIVISPEFIPSIMRHLQSGELVTTAISVIYNICSDYDRAQHAFRTNGLCSALVRVLADSNFDAGPLLPYVCSLLSFSTQQADLGDCSNQSLQTVTSLLQQPEVTPGDMLLIVNAISAFLQQERFRSEFVEHGLITVLIDVLTGSYTYEPQDLDTEEEISILRNAICQILSDISATNVFARSYPVNSPLVGSMIQWLSSPYDQLRIASCLVLGNLARSDSVCLDMVRRFSLHGKLLELVQNQSNVQVVYAALGFLRNLALPAENKSIIGTQQSVETISSFWSLDFNPQVQYISVCLLRQLLNNCIGNVRWLLESLSPDQDSPAHEKTYLSLLLLLFGRTDDISSKVEIGRTIATICRCIASSSQGLPLESTNAILHRLYGMHADIAKPLAMMVSQSRFPIIRSEGWFALALMARSREGATAVSEALQQMEIFGALVTTITGQPANGQAPNIQERQNRLSHSSSGSETRSEQEREMQAKDRENALVLVNELLKNTVRINFLFLNILRRFLYNQ